MKLGLTGISHFVNHLRLVQKLFSRLEYIEIGLKR